MLWWRHLIFHYQFSLLGLVGLTSKKWRCGDMLSFFLSFFFFRLSLDFSFFFWVILLIFFHASIALELASFSGAGLRCRQRRETRELYWTSCNTRYSAVCSNAGCAQYVFSFWILCSTISCNLSCLWCPSKEHFHCSALCSSVECVQGICTFCMICSTISFDLFSLWWCPCKEDPQSFLLPVTSCHIL